MSGEKGGVPQGWEIGSVISFLELQRGYDLPSQVRQEGNVPIVSANGISGTHSEAKVAPPGVTTGRSGTIGEVHFIEQPFWPLNTALYVKGFKGNDPKYVYYFLIHFDLLRFKSGGGVPTLNRNDVHREAAMFPPLPEQRKIAAILSTWDDSLATLTGLLAAKRQQKRGLAEVLLTGKKRLPGFAGEWEEKKLGEVFSERREIGRNDLPLLSITRNRGVILREEVDRKDTSNEDKSKYLRIAPGDIGYNTMRMWQGVSALSSFEGIVSPAYTICIPSQHISAEFAAHLFKTEDMIRVFERHSQGLTSDTWNLKFTHFSKIKIKLPPLLPEQKAIASILSTLDAEIASLEALWAKVQEQKRGLMDELLTGRVRVKVDDA